MDPTVPTSFIPKKNLDSSSRRGRGGATGLILLISILIFVMSVVAAGAAFGYTQLLKQSIANKSNSLAINERAYDPGVIQELIRIDNRLKEAKSLLQKHVAPTAIFAFLSQQTLERVQFRSFNFEIGVDGEISMSLSGLADAFSTVALQSDQFGASKVLKDVVFSDVNTDPATGKVGFTVEATVVPTLILYTNALTAGSGTIPPDTTPTPAPNATSTNQ